MYKPKQCLMILLVAVLLSGCLQQTQLVVPETLLQQLQGQWQEEGIAANRLTFYEDETVKVILPENDPPLKLLTHLEAVTDGVVLSFGDRWARPAKVNYDAAADRLVLGFYDEKKEIVVDRVFQRLPSDHAS